MKDKTKAKIDAMALASYGTKDRFCLYNTDEVRWHRRGQKPWVEWCERFDNCYLEDTQAIDMSKLIRVYEEYRQWLGEK